MGRFFGAFALALMVGLAKAQGQETGKDVFMHHAVTTTNPQAQASFDRGLTFEYAFNRQAAESAFREAATLDPNLAIAWWGVALALGPNINIDMSKDDMAAASDAIAKAKALETSASPEERAFIDALATRYAPNGDQKKLAWPYANAMQKMAAAYPDDPDVEALYLESMLDAIFKTTSAKYWAWDELVKRADSDVGRWPEHIGILHYFIHLTEPNTSALAIHVADTLAADTFAPQASHLTHMPSHVYMYVGDWAKMEMLNRKAVDMDIAQANAAGIEPPHLDYFFHNLSFWYGAAIMSGDESGALSAAGTRLPYNPDARWIAETRLGHPVTAMRLINDAGTALRLQNVGLDVLVAYGLTCAENGRIDDARNAVAQIRRHTSLGDVGKLALEIVNGRIAEAGGDTATARTLYSDAARLQDKTDFEAAPPWTFFPRELLAAMDLRTGNPSEAAGVTEADLLRHPDSNPSLKLLANADEALGRAGDANKIKQQLQLQSDSR